jgi:hypothetical protein
MASGQIIVRHLFGGGWATDFGPMFDGSPDASGQILIPFLITAQNVLYELDGGPHKKPGTSKLNGSALESGAAVMGLVDYWIIGTGGNPTQRRVVVVGTKVYADNADGSFSEILSGMTSGSVPSFAVIDDILIIADDSGNAPKSYDGTTAGNLAGSPPNFAFCVYHKGRAWAGGNPANPSRLYYSVLGNPEDWTGSGSGSIDIDKDDGDVLTGLASHKDQLVVFKGPYRGSIHLITGSSPTGDDAFARKPFVNGIGAVWHNTIFRYGDDLGFVSPQGTVHSLTTTAQYGDYRAGALSFPINDWLVRSVNATTLKKAWAAADTSRSLVLITMPVNGSSTNNIVLAMDYRFSPVRWSYWDDLTMACVASVVDPADARRRKLMSGHYDGYVRKQFASERSIDGATAISFNIETPFFNYGAPINMKTMVSGAIGLAPKNTGSFTFGWTRDSNAQQTESVDQGGGVGLDSFTLDTDQLGGARYVDRFFDAPNGGEFRAIQYQITHSTLGEDIEVHSITLAADVNGQVLTN